MPPPSSPSEGSLFAGVFAAGSPPRSTTGRCSRPCWTPRPRWPGRRPRPGWSRSRPPRRSPPCRADRFDPAELGALSAAAGNPVVPLVGQLADRLPPGVADHVHGRDQPGRARHGGHAGRPAGAAAAAGRPGRRRRRLRRPGRRAPRHPGRRRDPAPAGGPGHLRPEGGRLAGRPGREPAAAGRGRPGRPGRPARRGRRHLAAFGDRGLVVLAQLAVELDLSEPAIPWHAVRTARPPSPPPWGRAPGCWPRWPAASSPRPRWPRSARAGTRHAGVIGDAAQAEPRGGGGGGRLRRAGAGTGRHRPRRHGPGARARRRQLARRVGAPARPAAAGRLGAAWSRELLDGLEVDPARMRANLDAAGGLPMAEAAVGALAGAVGRARARDLVDQAARRASASGRPLGDTLLERPRSPATWARPGWRPPSTPAGTWARPRP